IGVEQIPLHVWTRRFCRHLRRMGFGRVRGGRLRIGIAHHFFHPRIRSYNSHSSVLSVVHRKVAISAQKAMTYSVIWIDSLRVGQTTFLTSFHESRPNAVNCLPVSDVMNTTNAAASATTSAPHWAN